MISKIDSIKTVQKSDVHTTSTEQKIRHITSAEPKSIKLDERAIRFIQLRPFRREIISTVNRALKFQKLDTVKHILFKTDLIIKIKKKQIIEELELQAIKCPKIYSLISTMKQDNIKKTIEDKIQPLIEIEKIPINIIRTLEEATDLVDLEKTYYTISTAYYGAYLTLEFLLSINDITNQIISPSMAEELMHEPNREEILKSINNHPLLMKFNPKEADFKVKMLEFIKEYEQQTGIYFPERLTKSLQQLNQA